MDHKVLKSSNNENHSKKTLTRPPFSVGYGNLKKIQTRPPELDKKAPLPLLKQKPLLPSVRSNADANKTAAQKPVTKLAAKNDENKPKSVNHVIPKRFSAVAIVQKPPKPKLLVNVIGKPSNPPKKIQSKPLNAQQKLSQKPIVAQAAAKSQQPPQSFLLDPSIWLSISQWCEQNKKNVSDFFYFSPTVKLTDKKPFITAPAVKGLPDSKMLSLEKHLNRLTSYLQKDNFPPGLMFDYLSNLAEKFSHVKDCSMFWTILADCKLKEGAPKDVSGILIDAYKAKAKPPGKLIETYQLLVTHLMENLAIKEEEVPEEAPVSENIEKKEVETDESEANSFVKTDSVPNELKQEETDSTNSPATEVAKDFSNVLSDTVLLEDTQEINTALTTPRRKSVIFADPVEAKIDEPADLSDLNQSESFESEPAVANEESNENAPDLSDLVVFKTPDSSSAVFQKSNSAKSNRRTDVFDHSLMFLSSQRKYAVLSEKNNENSGNKTYLTPVRRSARIHQEQDILPQILQEKLTLYDSPFQVANENMQIRRNSALRNSFGGVLNKSEIEEDPSDQDESREC